MIIESPEALKEWLTTILEPMCEADPRALAKYVIALVKKDKSISELHDTCIDQLDVFLQQETKPFVELLFKTLENKSYLVKQEVSLPVAAQPTPPGIEQPVPLPVPAPVNNVPSNAVVSTNASSTVGLPTVSKIPERRVSHPEPVNDGEERDRRLSNKTGGTSHSRSRSRSRSRNRSRSRSRDRDDRRSRRTYGDEDRRRRGTVRRHDRHGGYRRDRSRERLDRKRSRSRSVSRSRSRSNSKTRADSKDKNRIKNDVAQKNQISSNQDHGDTDYRFGVPSSVATGNMVSSTQSVVSTVVAPIPPPVGLSVSDSQSAFTARNTRRCRDYDEKGYCMRGDLCPYDHGADPVVVEEAHLPTMLAYGPGNPGVPPSLPPGPPGPGARPQGPPPVPIPPLLGPPMPHPRPPLPQPPISLLGTPGTRPPFLPLPDQYVPEPYNPEAPAMDRIPPRIRPPFWGPRMGPGRGPGSRLPPQYLHTTRELINVPTVDDATIADAPPSSNNRTVVPPQKRPAEEPPGPSVRIFRSVGNTPNKAAVKRRPFDYNRLGNRKFNVENAALELRKIPHGLNCITQLNNHFSRFGKIVNLQVCYEGDPEAALIQFSSHAEAHAAYRSTEAVLNNRFIKVFWHNKDGVTTPKQENNLSPVKKLSAKERLGMPINKASSEEFNSTTPVPVPHSNDDNEKSTVIMATSGSLSKTVFNPAALKKSNISLNVSNAAVSQAKVQQIVTAQENIKKKQEEQRKEAMKINADLQKRKQVLLQKQIQQQKLLIDKLEKNKSMSVAERSKIMKTLKDLQESIEKLKVELTTTVQTPSPAVTQTSHPKTKQEAQKEILDIEMELYNKQHQGADTTELKKKVAELKQEAMSLGLIGGRPQLGRGRGVVKRLSRAASAFRGRGRGVGLGARSLDHRPRRLQITGFEEEERDEVVAHLNQFGEVESVEIEDGGLSLIVTYKNRREAEMVVLQGAKFKGRTLIMMWHQNSGIGSHGVGDGHDGITDGITGEEELLDPEAENEDLLLGDDEEEEDSEARSWRR